MGLIEAIASSYRTTFPVLMVYCAVVYTTRPRHVVSTPVMRNAGKVLGTALNLQSIFHDPPELTLAQAG